MILTGLRQTADDLLSFSAGLSGRSAPFGSSPGIISGSRNEQPEEVRRANGKPSDESAEYKK
jgi:hypothetical protein